MMDLVLAARSLKRAPLLSAVAVLTIALGIGATTTLYSVFDAVWLEPLPFRDAERLVALTVRDGQRQARGMSAPNFTDLHERTSSFETLTGFNLAELNVIWEDRPELATAWQVRGDFFDLLGIDAALGRGLVPDDARPGAEHVVVLSHDYWTTRFGADPDVVGMTLVLESGGYRNVPRQPYTIVGVVSPRAWFERGVELWTPFYLSEEERTDRDGRTFWLIGRLLPDVSLSTARAELTTLLTMLADEHPPENGKLTLEIAPMHQWHYGDERQTVVLLFAAAALLLLIASGNVAHLMVTRLSQRGRELSVRAALGAGRGRIARLLLSEGLLLTFLGGSVGLALALRGIALAQELLPRALIQKLPTGADAVVLNARALAFALVVMVVTLAASAAFPLVRAARVDLVRGLRSSSSSEERGLLVHPLVVSEVALSILLLVAAGVTLRSSRALETTDLGFEPTGVMDFWVSPSGTKYPGPDEKRAFYRLVRERVEAVPGIGTVGFTNRFPHQMWSSRHTFDVVAIRDDSPVADVRAVDAGYFQTMRIQLLAGRHFDQRDNENAQHVAIVNQYLAAHYWPNEDPVGKSLRLQVGDDVTVVRVVGLAADVHVPLQAEKHPIIYRPWQQAPPVWVDVLVRSEMFSEELAEEVRQAIWSVDPNHFIDLYDTGDGPAIWFHRTRFAASLLSAFSGLAFMLSAGGVFAVVSFQIRRRRRELGIRKAVGASDRDLTSLLLGRTLRETAVGIALGVLASWASTRYLRELLYGVEPMDPLSIVSAVLVILVAAVLATYIPARRVRRIHPAEVLRTE